MVDHVIIVVAATSLLIAGCISLWFYHRRSMMEDNEEPEFYTDYLRSKKWEDLRRQALERSHNQCEFCGAAYRAVHHIKYPKKYKNDQLENLLVVCDRCHAKLHGVRDNAAPEKNNTVKAITTGGILHVEEVKSGSHMYYLKLLAVHETQCSLQIMESGKKGVRYIEIMEEDLTAFANMMQRGLSLLNSSGAVTFEEKLLGIQRTYFFEIKYAINERKYLKVTESRRKEHAVFEQEHVIVFEDGSKLVAIGLQNTLHFIQQPSS